MDNAPYYPAITFISCVITTCGFLIYAISRASTPRSNTTIIFGTYLSLWIFITITLGSQDFFVNFEMPPRLILFALLPLALIVLLFSYSKTRAFIGLMPVTTLTYIHMVRVPVEIVLWWLYAHGVVSEAMTFQGINYDIVTGISAPFAGIFIVGVKSKTHIAAMLWHFMGLVFLGNIVVISIRCSPYFFDVAHFDLPNLAVFHFPYLLLPLFIVPALLFCHLAALYQLILTAGEEKY